MVGVAQHTAVAGITDPTSVVFRVPRNRWKWREVICGE